MKEDLTGKRFGKLTVLQKLDRKKNGSWLWLCKCDCGNKKEATTRDLNGKRVRSCGCGKGSSKSLVGKRFGKLVVVKDSGEKTGTKKLWLCKCDCGGFVKVRTDSLTSGRTTSCKCNLEDEDRIKSLNDGKKMEDHTSSVFFKGTVSKNSITGINGVTKLRNGKYRAYIGYKRKTYVLYEGKEMKKAIDARAEAEKMVKKGEFEKWIGILQKRKSGKEEK